MASKGTRSRLGREQAEEILATLEERFERNQARHPGIPWKEVRARLERNADSLHALHEMERTGGEPDVIGLDPHDGTFLFADCSSESPEGRRSLCYDTAALEARKKHPPRDSAVAVADAMGARLLTEAEYHTLQGLGDFDTKTSSWLLTPPDVRERGGAIFGDRRFGRVFIYHNGADSYYAARGFRCLLKV